jgi:hypothetical protein
MRVKPMFVSEWNEIHILQNELTQQLGVSAHNLAVSHFFVTARNTVNYGRDAEAVNTAMDALRHKIAEIRAMPRMERAALGMPKRVPYTPPPTPKVGFVEVESEVKVLGGMMALAMDGTAVQLIGCGIDQLSHEARFAMSYSRDAFVGVLKRRSGLM